MIFAAFLGPIHHGTLTAAVKPQHRVQGLLELISPKMGEQDAAAIQPAHHQTAALGLSLLDSTACVLLVLAVPFADGKSLVICLYVGSKSPLHLPCTQTVHKPAECRKEPYLLREERKTSTASVYPDCPWLV